MRPVMLPVLNKPYDPLAKSKETSLTTLVISLSSGDSILVGHKRRFIDSQLNVEKWDKRRSLSRVTFEDCPQAGCTIKAIVDMAAMAMQEKLCRLYTM